MNTYKSIILYLTFCLLVFSGCGDDKNSISLKGDTFIEKLVLDEQYEGLINNESGSIIVEVPEIYDTRLMTVSEIVASKGAEISIKVGDKINFSFPQSIRVKNGDAFFDYNVNVKHDEAKILSFKLNGLYNGEINDETSIIKVYVPLNTDLSAMSVEFSVNEGTKTSIKNNDIIDFTSVVELRVEYKTSIKVYKIYVEESEMSQEPKAFVGRENSIDELSPEAKAAAEWMINNIPNSVYISLNDVKNETIHLEDYKMIWCHFDWTDWPSLLWDTRDFIYNYWNSGGNILASRDGARYINDVWRISKNQKEPNNIFGGDESVRLDNNIGFSVKGYSNHEIYHNIEVDEDDIIMLRSAGCYSTNRTLQWGVDWDPYYGIEGWKEQTGAIPLASSDPYDINRVTIAEFIPRVIGQKTSGKVITVGTPAFEWKDADINNQYFSNMEILTKNMINYLCK